MEFLDINSESGSQSYDLGLLALFAKNQGPLRDPSSFGFVPGVIALSWLSKKVTAILVTPHVVSFPFSPALIVSLQRGAINPIPFGVISVFLQPNPRFHFRDCSLLHNQFVNKVVLFGCFDYSEVCSPTLTSFSSITPFLPSKSADDKA